MDEAEFRLLDVVVAGRVRMDWLLWDGWEEATNRPGHGLGPDALLELLDRLFRDGIVDASAPAGDGGYTGRALSRPEIEAALDGTTRDVVYGLTPRGGARWEAVTKADWSRFVEELHGLDPDEVEVSGQDRDRVVSYLRRFTRHRLVTGSGRWEELTPWEATYWKTLPRGYRVTAAYERDERVDIDRDECERWLWWYTDPFDGTPQR